MYVFFKKSSFFKAFFLFFLVIQNSFCLDVDFLQRSFLSTVLGMYWGFQMGKVAPFLRPENGEECYAFLRVLDRLGHGVAASILAEGYKVFLQRRVWNDQRDQESDCIKNIITFSGMLFCASYAAVYSYQMNSQFPPLHYDIAACASDLAVSFYVHPGFFSTDPKRRMVKMLGSVKNNMLSKEIKQKIFCEAKELYRQELRFFIQQRDMFYFPRDVLYTKNQREWLLNVQRICALSTMLFPIDIKQQIVGFLNN